MIGGFDKTILEKTGLQRSGHLYANWLGVECGTVRLAIWMMRIIVVCNVLARREGTVVFVPINPVQDPEASVVSGAVARAYSLAATKGVA